MGNGTTYGRTWSIGELSKLAGVSVRTLHHYDDIELLPPAGRTAAGYRAYDEEDLLRLQRILAYRELGFSLEDVARILDDPAVDAQEHLLRQRELLTDRIEKLQLIVDAVDRTLEARKMGLKLDPQEMFEVFGENDPTQYEEETRERWGDTDAYKQSQQRTSSYGKEQWLQIKAEGDAGLAAFAAAFGAGLPPDSPEAMDAAEAARQYMSRWFYDLGTDMHRGLADMYLADERFTAYFERVVEGLAAYVHAAIHANADRQEGKAASS